jgi:hypothetical protein
MAREGKIIPPLFLQWLFLPGLVHKSTCIHSRGNSLDGEGVALRLLDGFVIIRNNKGRHPVPR